MARSSPWDDLGESFTPNLTRDALDTLEDFEVITSFGTGAIIYSRRFGAMNNIATNLRAVAVAATLGLSSVDYARKRYGFQESDDDVDGSSANHPVHSAYVACYRAAREHVRQCERALLTNQDVKLGLGTLAASIALERLRSGFISAHLLYSLGLNIEGDAVARQVLEQIAWSVAASEHTENDEIERVSATKAISLLKRLVPYAGPLYGWLSQNVHAGVSQHREAFQLDDQDRGVILTSWSRRTIASEIVLSLADIWVVAYEWTQRDHMMQFVAIDPESGFAVLPDREFLRHAHDMIDAVKLAQQSSETSVE